MVASFDVSDQLRGGVQRNFTKKLKGMGNFSYDERLKILNIDRLEFQRIKFNLVLFLKNYK